MKLAVIFLCLSVASFIGTNKGVRGQDAVENQNDPYSLTLCHLVKQCQHLQKCPLEEQLGRRLVLVDGIICYLKMCAYHLQLKFETLLTGFGWTDRHINALLFVDITLIITLFGSIDAVLFIVVDFTQCLMAHCGIVLHTVMTVYFTAWGVPGLISFCPGIYTTTSVILANISKTLQVFFITYSVQIKIFVSFFSCRC